MGRHAGRGYDYNRPRKSHRNHRIDRWLYRGKLAAMLVVGGGIAVYIVYLAITK